MTWEEIYNDPLLAKWPGRVESDKWGNAIMGPPAGADHCDYQGAIIEWLIRLMRGGRVHAEYPLQTDEGVKAVDVIWGSRERHRQRPRKSIVHLIAPEICVEVQSPSNSFREIMEKLQLYFARDAKECWMCSPSGHVTFFSPNGPIPRSELCPDFPEQPTFQDEDDEG